MWKLGYQYYVLISHHLFKTSDSQLILPFMGHLSNAGDFFFFCFFGATPKAVGGSQAKG